MLYDDRDERPGVLFKDADLAGIPIRLAVSKKSVAAGGVEVKLRRAREFTVVPAEKVVEHVKELIKSETEYYSNLQ